MNVSTPKMGRKRGKGVRETGSVGLLAAGYVPPIGRIKNAPPNIMMSHSDDS